MQYACDNIQKKFVLQAEFQMLFPGYTCKVICPSCGTIRTAYFWWAQHKRHPVENGCEVLYGDQANAGEPRHPDGVVLPLHQGHSTRRHGRYQSDLSRPAQSQCRSGETCTAGREGGKRGLHEMRRPAQCFSRLKPRSRMIIILKKPHLNNKTLIGLSTLALLFVNNSFYIQTNIKVQEMMHGVESIYGY